MILLATFAMAFTYTFHSRAKVSGSLRYHAVVAVLANLTYAIMLACALQFAGGGWSFAVLYTIGATLGGLASHWACLRWERGAARTVQEDRVLDLERRIKNLEGGQCGQ